MVYAIGHLSAVGTQLFYAGGPEAVAGVGALVALSLVLLVWLATRAAAAALASAYTAGTHTGYASGYRAGCDDTQADYKAAAADTADGLSLPQWHASMARQYGPVPTMAVR